jgi:hypothetical protein
VNSSIHARPATEPPRTREARKPARWALRRTLSFVLIASGIIWIALGLAIRLLYR